MSSLELTWVTLVTVGVIVFTITLAWYSAGNEG